MIRRIGFSVFCLFAAIGCYSFGVPTGGVAFFVLGMGFEVLFWFGIFGRRKRSADE